MDFGNLLGSLGGALSQQQAVPGFAGGMIPLPRTYEQADDGWRNAFGEAQGADPSIQNFDQFMGIQRQAQERGMPGIGAMPAPLPGQQRAQKKPFAESGLGMIMGVIGDALLARNGLNPIYAPTMLKQKQRRNQGQALANYLGQLDPKMTNMLQSGEIDPGDALSLYKIVHPTAEKSSSQRDYEYYQGLDQPGRAGFEKYLQLTHPGMLSPLTMGPNDTLEMPGAEAPASAETTATDANGNKVRYNPETGQWEPMGGPTAQPSASFP